MELSEELRKAIIKEVSEHLQYPEDVEVSQENIKITLLCVTVTDHLLIEIEE